MRAKYRCIHDIVYDLLSTLAGESGVVKTKLCTTANMPIDRCNEVLRILETYGLVTGFRRNRETVYVLTDRGYAYIGLYEQLNHLLNLPHRSRERQV